MSDETVIEGQTEGDPPAKAALSPEEVERRLENAGRTMREQRAEIRALRELMEMRPAGQQPQTQAQKAEVPDPEVDPIGFIKYAKGRLEGFDAERELTDKQAREQQAQQNNLHQLSQRMAEYEVDFRGDHPDYDKAAEHFRDARIKELGEEGVHGQAANGALQQSLAEIVARAIRAGKDPAEVIYKLAKNRGFGVDDGSKKLQTIERAQSAGKSLSNAGGASGNSELTIEHVNSLTGKEFTAAFARYKAQQKAAERRRA